MFLLYTLYITAAKFYPVLFLSSYKLSQTPCSSFIMRIIRAQTNETISDVQVLDNLTDSVTEFHRNLREILSPLIDLKSSISTSNFLTQIKGTAAAEDLSHVLSFRFAYFVVFAIQLCPSLHKTIQSIHAIHPSPADTSSSSILIHSDLGATLDSLCNSVLLFQQQIREIISPVFDLLNAESTARFVQRVQNTPAAADLAYVLSWRFAYFVRFTTMICPTIEGLCRMKDESDEEGNKVKDEQKISENVTVLQKHSTASATSSCHVRSEWNTDEKKVENGSKISSSPFQILLRECSNADFGSVLSVKKVNETKERDDEKT